MLRLLLLKKKRAGAIVLILGCLTPAAASTFVIDYVRRTLNARRPVSNTLVPITRYLHFHTPHEADFANYAALASIKDEKLAAGTPAADLALHNVADGGEVRLSQFRGRKPLFLVFGSLSCNVFQHNLPRLNALYETYHGSVEFLFVYVSEAPHPDPLPPPSRPETKEERIRRGLRHFQVKLPCCIAENQGAMQTAYHPLPERLFLIDSDGGIVLDAGLGLGNGWNFEQIETYLKDWKAAAVNH